MAVRTFGEPIVEFSGESVTTGTDAVSIGIPPGIAEVIVYGAAAHRVQIGAKIVKCLKTTDIGVTFTDYTTQATDRNIATLVDLSDLPVEGTGYWYLGSNHKFGGCTIDIIGPNSTATSTMTAYYWNGTAWTNTAITDNTASGSVCLAVDGTVTITTVPSAWAKTTATDNSGLTSYPGLYFIRFQSDKVMDEATTLGEISLLPDAVAAPYGYMAATTDYVFSLNASQCGSLAFYNNGDGSTVSISWLRHSKLGNT